MFCFTRTLRTAMALSLVLPTALHADDWPQWRGPQRDGAWRETGLLQSFPADCVRIKR